MACPTTPFSFRTSSAAAWGWQPGAFVKLPLDDLPQIRYKYGHNAIRGRGSVGRMSPCQGEGRGFESHRPLTQKAAFTGGFLLSPFLPGRREIHPVFFPVSFRVFLNSIAFFETYHLQVGVWGLVAPLGRQSPKFLFPRPNRPGRGRDEVDFMKGARFHSTKVDIFKPLTYNTTCTEHNRRRGQVARQGSAKP